MPDELGAIEPDLKGFQMSCVDSDATCEGRQGAGAQEIEALRAAQDILVYLFTEKDQGL